MKKDTEEAAALKNAAVRNSSWLLCLCMSSSD